MIKIIGIKCKDKYYITKYISTQSRLDHRYVSVFSLIINGKKPKMSFNLDWSIVDSEVHSVQKIVKQPFINHRYELIDPSVNSVMIPLEYKKDVVADDNGHWLPEFKMYESLYKFVSDDQPDKIEDVEFEYETILEVENIDENIYNYKYANSIKLQHQLIDEILFPSIVLPSKPCSLTQLESYNVIRKYVKEHINNSVATITSDYDLGFTVRKIIPLSEAETYSVEVNNTVFSSGKNKKSKYVTTYKKEREVEIFNMAPESHKQYNVIKGFVGKNQKDLDNNIENYCKNLIKVINEPVKDCSHCKGRGVILNDS